MRSPLSGCAKARRVACRNWRFRPKHAGGAVLGVAGDGMADRAQVHADLMRAPGVELQAQQRVLGERTVELEVRACVTCVRRCRSAMRVRTRASRPIGASIVPLRAGGRPCTSARYSRSISRRASGLLQRRVGLLGARDDEQAGGVAVEAVDDAGARGVAAGRTVARAACESVSSRWPLAGCTTTPGGLSTTSRCSSSYAMRNGCSPAAAGSGVMFARDVANGRSRGTGWRRRA